MPGLLYGIVVVLSFALAATAIPQQTKTDTRHITDLLKGSPALPTSSLHIALHRHLQPRFKDGVFEHDFSAVAVVHNEDPSLASKLVGIASAELQKRQDSNDTATPETTEPVPDETDEPTQTEEPTETEEPIETDSEPSSSSEESQSTNEGVVVSVEVSTTDSQGSVVVKTTAAVVEPTETVDVVVTETDDDGEVTTKSSKAPAAVVTVTDSDGDVLVTTKAVPRVGDVVTATETNSAGETFTTVRTAGGGVSSMIVIATTLADGTRSTMTTFTVVGGTGTADEGDDPDLVPSGADMVVPVILSGTLSIFGVLAGIVFML